MKVYKYRGKAKLQRDVASLAANTFFSPTAEQLNDPSELVLGHSLEMGWLRAMGDGIGTIVNQMENMRHSVGIYSLSRVATDELMWAHYAESHRGYCIEYDLERLVREARTQWSTVPVVYADCPPSLEMTDLRRSDNGILVTTKLVGHKSKRWAYEEEIRITTARAGAAHYAQAAVTGVYFGYRCSESTQWAIRSALRDRSVRYFRLTLPESSYEFTVDDVPPAAVDGSAGESFAPVESEAVPSAAQLGKFAHLHPQVLRAVDLVRRDPSCVAVPLAGVRLSGRNEGRIFVQYKTLVPTDLGDMVNWYFCADDDRLWPVV